MAISAVAPSTGPVLTNTASASPASAGPALKTSPNSGDFVTAPGGSGPNGAATAHAPTTYSHDTSAAGTRPAGTKKRQFSPLEIAAITFGALAAASGISGLGYIGFRKGGYFRTKAPPPTPKP